MFPRRRYRVAVLGATGAVGTELLKELDARRFPTSDVRALTSTASAGAEVSFGKRTLIAAAAVATQFDDVELVFAAAGDETSREWLPIAQAAGAVCIDCAQWARDQDDTPMVIPELNPEKLAFQRGLISSPSASTCAAALTLAPLKTLGGGLQHVALTTLEPASGAGRLGLSELSGQAVALLNFQPVDVEVLPARLAFNCIPQTSPVDDDSVSADERALEAGLKRLLGVTAHATSIRVPVFVGIGLSITATFAENLDGDVVRAALQAADGITLVDSGEPPYPMVMDISERDGVQVGRLRVRDNTVQLWVVIDNLRTGAATNMVQIAELLDAVWTAAQA